jgi:molybdopterin synthase sulfur carrier subunit
MIDVLFFGRIADLMRERSLTLEVEDGQTTFKLRDKLFQSLFADGAITPASIRMSVNQSMSANDTAISDGDEVAFFSIFSGG